MQRKDLLLNTTTAYKQEPVCDISYLRLFFSLLPILCALVFSRFRTSAFSWIFSEIFLPFFIQWVYYLYCVFLQSEVLSPTAPRSHPKCAAINYAFLCVCVCLSSTVTLYQQGCFMQQLFLTELSYSRENMLPPFLIQHKTQSPNMHINDDSLKTIPETWPHTLTLHFPAQTRTWRWKGRGEHFLSNITNSFSSEIVLVNPWTLILFPVCLL